MQTETFEVYSNTTNMPVIRHPGRQFPGVLIQGDTLHSVISSLRDLAAALPASTAEDALGDLEFSLEILEDMLAHYEATLSTHGISLPYFKGPGQ